MKPETALRKNEDRSIDIARFIGSLSDRKKFDELVEEYFKLMPALDNGAKRARFALTSFASQDVLIMYGINNSQNLNSSLDSLLIKIILERMMKHGLVIPNQIGLDNEYTVCSDCFRKALANDLLDNMILGREYSIQKYKDAIPYIVVASENGKENIGTGVVIGVNQRLFLVTNKHVVENKKVTAIKTDSIEYNKISDPHISESLDLAIIEVSGLSRVPRVVISASDPLDLTRIVAMGYPTVPGTKEPVLLKHQGEVNGSIDSYLNCMEQLLVISCYVTPGNSGGPIMNDIGVCVGIVTQSNEGKYQEKDTGTERPSYAYHMAIPPSTVLNFIRRSYFQTSFLRTPRDSHTRE